MKQTISYLILALCSLLVQSCASMSQFQTAKPMGEGNVSHKISVNGTVRQNGEGIPFFVPEYGVNYGVTDKFDFIGKINAFGSMSFGGKYTITDNQDSESAFAIGGSMNYFGRILNITIPAHITFEPSDLFSFTISPSYTTPGLYKLKTNIDDEYYRDINSGFFGVSPYMEVGKRVKFFVGCNFSFAKSSMYADYGLGVRFNILTRTGI